jgi:hypothetical protein
MTTGVKYAAFLSDLAHHVHNFDTDVFKVALTNRTPVPETDAVFSDISEISAGNGYTAGGNVAAFVSFSTTSGFSVILGNPAAFTASGGSIGPFQYVVLYNDTASTKPLVGYWDYGSVVTLSVAELFLVSLDPTGGAIILD